MATGASSLGIVREELFATMLETQQNLERFLEERDSGTLLQRSVHNLQQIKGILSLVGLAGAELLAQEMQTLAMGIPADADAQYNDQLSAINNGLHVLHSYLEQLEANWVEKPELLLPAINQLSKAVAPAGKLFFLCPPQCRAPGKARCAPAVQPARGFGTSASPVPAGFAGSDSRTKCTAGTERNEAPDIENGCDRSGSTGHDTVLGVCSCT